MSREGIKYIFESDFSHKKMELFENMWWWQKEKIKSVAGVAQTCRI